MSGALIILLLITLIIPALFISQKRKFSYRQDVIDLKHAYGQEVMKTPIETQMTTFRTILQELYDNVGTVIFMAMVHLNSDAIQSKHKDQQRDAHALLHEAMGTLRGISRSVNLENIIGRPSWKLRTPFSMNFFSLPKYLLISLALTLVAMSGHGQTSSEYLATGIEAERRHQEDSALRNYETAIMLNPTEAEAYWRASRIYSSWAGRNSDRAIKKNFASKANALADKGLLLNPKETEAHLALIISLGMLADAASSPREKLRNAKRIRQVAESLIIMDPQFAPAYYVLGKWHYELSLLSWLERAACDLLFGGMPEGVSMDKSLMYFLKAVDLQPDYILFRYGQACALYEKGEYKAAIVALEMAMYLQVKEPDDHVRLKKCKTLLDKARQAGR